MVVQFGVDRAMDFCKRGWKKGARKAGQEAETAIRTGEQEAMEQEAIAADVTGEDAEAEARRLESPISPERQAAEQTDVLRQRRKRIY